MSSDTVESTRARPHLMATLGPAGLPQRAVLEGQPRLQEEGQASQGALGCAPTLPLAWCSGPGRGALQSPSLARAPEAAAPGLASSIRPVCVPLVTPMLGQGLGGAEAQGVLSRLGTQALPVMSEEGLEEPWGAGGFCAGWE